MGQDWLPHSAPPWTVSMIPAQMRAAVYRGDSMVSVDTIGTPEIAIAEIVIAERHRQDMGDIAELAGKVVMT